MKKLILGLLFLTGSIVAHDVEPIDFDTSVSPNIYRAYVVGVYDGDSYTVRINLWHDTIKEVKIRLLGVDCPEVKGEEREAGIEVRNHVRSLILGKWIWLFPAGKDKYGRTLAQVEFRFQEDMAKHLLGMGFAKEYMADKVPYKER